MCENQNGMDIDELYDLWFHLGGIRAAIKELKSGRLRKVLDDESLASAIYYMVTRDMGGAIEQENGLPNCVDNYLEYLQKIVEEKMVKVNKEIDRLRGEA
jgi:hypothetical protein